MTPFDLALPSVRELSPYQPGKPIGELQRELGLTEIVKLASNENPLGPSPLAVAAAQRVLEELHLYPDGSGFELKAALARRLSVSPEQITLGNGSNDVLEIIAHTFLSPGVEAVYSEHAFAVYPIVTQAIGARARVAPAHDGSRGPRYGHDEEALAAAINADTRLVFIANPNNPTGTYLPRQALRRFLDALPEHVLAVIDEAYFEYVEAPDYPDCLEWLAEFPNLIVTRTFSKAYGLAGLRVGYAVSSVAIADLLNRVRQPFNVNSIGLAAAVAALADGEHLQRSLLVNRDGLQQLRDGLGERGFECVPSVGNFVSFDLRQPAAPIFSALLREGVIVRPIANYGLPQHLRVTVGSEAENRFFLHALDRVLAR